MSQTEVLVDSPVIVSQTGQVKKISLNRPRALNAINLQMVEIMLAAVAEAQHDGTRVILIDGEGERGLSGGGDIKEMAHDGAANAHQFIAREYELDLALANSDVPVVALMRGITMGGGIGISGHADIRVVTDNSRLAMPEVKIGIIPDVGGNLLLSKAPGRLGEYLALTASSFTAGDAVALGFADFYIPEKEIETFCNSLSGSGTSRAEIYALAASFAKEAPHSNLKILQSLVDPLFENALEHSTAVTIAAASANGGVELADWAVDSLQKLVAVCEASSERRERDLGETLRQMSPTSLAVALAQIARTKTLSLGLEEVLQDDLRILTRMFKLPDFVEGVRALAIDKDQSPTWNPAAIEDLDRIMISRILDPA